MKKKTTKKIFAALLIGLVAFSSMTGCGSKEEQTDKTTEDADVDM